MPEDDLARWTAPTQTPLPVFRTKKAGNKWAASSEGRRFIAEDWMRTLARHWQQTHNPLDALQTYELARHIELPVPEWVLRYLDHAVTALLDIAHSQVPRARRPSQVMQALQLRPVGRGRKRDAFDTSWDRDWKIAHRMLLLRKVIGLTYEKAREAAADEFHLSESGVDRAWRKHHAFVEAEIAREKSRQWLFRG